MLFYDYLIYASVYGFNFNLTDVIHIETLCYINSFLILLTLNIQFYYLIVYLIL